MTLSELLESKFRGDIRFRGSAYLKAERVSIVRVTPEQVFGVVRDGVEYQTQLSRDEASLRMHCNCARAGQSEPTCKHLWATILAVDEGGLLAGAARPGYIPPFNAETEPLDLEDEDWEDEDDGLGFASSTTSTRRTATVQVQPRLRDWEATLLDLRKQMETDEPTAASAAGREREIFYEIDVEQSREHGQLVIETSQRQRRSNGQWGKLKPLKLRPGKLDEIEHDEDRRILAHLSGGTPERTTWHAQQTEIQASVHRYRVPFHLCELVLPLMCASGRARFLGSDERSEPLAWDEGPPWELCVGLTFDATQDLWKLEGQLRRDEETLPVRETELLVPGGLVLTPKTIARLQDFGAFPWVSLLGRGDGLNVPAGEEHELVDRLLDMPALPRLELPEELRLEEVRCEPTPHLIVHAPRRSRWQQEKLNGEVAFEYDETLVPGSSAQWAIVQRQEGRCLLRDKGREEEHWAQLQDCGFRRLLDQRRGQHDVEIQAGQLGPAVRKLIALGWQVRADGKQVHQPIDLRFQIKSNIDWFELHGQVDFGGGGGIAFPELLAALSRGESTVRLDDGSLGILPEEWIRRYGLLAGLGATEEDHLRFRANQVGLLDALLATQEGVDYDERFRELRQKLRDFAGVPAAEAPEGFHGELRGYQRDGLGWLHFLKDFNFGGCLADDMGLGKTIQILALLEERARARDERLPSIVVVPKSLLFNWQQESERFTPQLKVLEYSGVDRPRLRDEFPKYDLILTTYGTLRRDVLALKEVRFDYVILDEAQAIKNSGSQVAKASRLLQANHRVALSGTPIENHLGDLCSIFEFLNPGMLGRSSVVKSQASNPADRDSQQILAQGLRPFILRRTKQSVASELPDKVEQTILCRMGAEQERLYAELREHYRESLLGMVEQQGLAKTKIHVLEALLRLRQAACHPALLQKGSQEDSSAKLDVLCPHLEELVDEGHKTLVFSQFTSMLSIVRHHLDQRGIVYEYLDGQTRDRKQRVERFQSDPDCGVFLISLKAGGLGLNLTAADYVFLLDPWWNPAVETQAIDRAHRVGQTRQVFAYRLICRGTVEEKIAELQKQKRELADAILEQNNAMLRDLTAEDLQLLLS